MKYVNKSTLFFFFILLVITFTLLGIFAWSQRSNVKRWVAVGEGDTTLIYSNDGKKWTQVNGLFGDEEVGVAESVTSAGGRWVVVGRDGDDEGANIWWSNDAVYWDMAVNNDDNDDIFFGTGDTDSGTKVAHVGGLWLAGGNSSSDNLYWSKNGREWNLTVGDVFLGGVVRDIKYASWSDKPWLVCGDNDEQKRVLYYSENGQDWEKGPEPILGGTDGFCQTIAHNEKNLWILGGYNTSGAGGQFLWWSNNGSDWTKISTTLWGANGKVNKIIYANKKWVAVGENDGVSGQAIGYSSTGKIWSTASGQDTQGYNLKDIVYEKEKWITSGNDTSGKAVVLTSKNGEEWSLVSEEDFTSLTNINPVNVLATNEEIILLGADAAESGSLWYSENNGEKWDEPTNNPFGLDSNVKDILYA